MTNVQEALKSIDIEKLLCDADLPLPSHYDAAYFHEYLARYKKFAESYHAALVEIDKCDPVHLISSGAHEIAVSKVKYDEWTSAKRISYTSPQPREWVGLSEDEIVKIMDGTEFNEDNFCILEAAINYCRAIESALKQINIKG